jgi:hypothetical protein
MKRKIDVESILRRIPRGAALPAGFSRFVSAVAAQDPTVHGWFEVKWRTPQDFELKKSASLSLLPFLRLGDGGVVAFWFVQPKKPAVIHFDSEGGQRVVAATFEDFLKRIAKQKTGVGDFDEAELPAIKPPRTLALTSLAAIQKRFAAWCADASTLQAPTVSNASEVLRKQLHQVARRMIQNGLSKVYTSRDYWSMDFRFERTAGAISISYLDYGQYYPVPSAYAMEPLLQQLLPLCRQRNLKKGELVITKDGLVSVDRDRQLVLLPPKLRE